MLQERVKTQEIIDRLRDHEADLRSRGVLHVALFGSRARGDNRPDSDVDLHCKLPPNPTYESTAWWTNQNCVEHFNSLQKALPGQIKWLEQHAPLRPEVENGKVVHRDRNVVCVWLPPKPLQKE